MAWPDAGPALDAATALYRQIGVTAVANRRHAVRSSPDAARHGGSAKVQEMRRTSGKPCPCVASGPGDADNRFDGGHMDLSVSPPGDGLASHAADPVDPGLRPPAKAKRSADLRDAACRADSRSRIAGWTGCPPEPEHLSIREVPRTGAPRRGRRRSTGGCRDAAVQPDPGGEPVPSLTSWTQIKAVGSRPLLPWPPLSALPTGKATHPPGRLNPPPTSLGVCRPTRRRPGSGRRHGSPLRWTSRCPPSDRGWAVGAFRAWRCWQHDS